MRETFTPTPLVRAPQVALPYVRVRTRFIATVLAGLAWASFSTWLALGWISELAGLVTLPVAIFVIAGIALIPGYLNIQLVTALLLDRLKPLRFDRPFPAISLLIAAYNEEERIGETLAYALRQDYPGELEIVVVDDGSLDRTREIVLEVAAEDERVRLVRAQHGGKANALNAALGTIENPLVATIDADTLLLPSSLSRAVGRLLASPADTVAVAGAVLVRNSRANFLTRFQEWDYFLGIASVKRQQGLLQGTLVAQGAFSVYDTEAVREIDGWPDRIGEDIVLTWALIRNGGRTVFEPTAVAFTATPTGLRHFARQRQRWARGMIEGLREHGASLARSRRMHAHSVSANFLFPYLDGIYCLVFLPGIGLAATGNFMIVGPMTAAVLPLTLLVAFIMFLRQRSVFRQLGLRVRRNVLGFLGYLLVYQPLMSAISFSGYAKELARARRVW
jgi:biofilm PGA synthesis N-glycosyltransferase PgaC